MNDTMKILKIEDQTPNITIKKATTKEKEDKKEDNNLKQIKNFFGDLSSNFQSLVKDININKDRNKDKNKDKSKEKNKEKIKEKNKDENKDKSKIKEEDKKNEIDKEMEIDKEIKKELDLYKEIEKENIIPKDVENLCGRDTITSFNDDEQVAIPTKTRGRAFSQSLKRSKSEDKFKFKLDSSNSSDSKEDTANISKSKYETVKTKKSIKSDKAEEKIDENQLKAVLAKIKEFDKQRLENFLKINVRKDVMKPIDNYQVGDLSIPEIFNSIYNQNTKHSIFGNKSFAEAYADKRQDYDLKIKYNTNLIEDQINKPIHSYFRTNDIKDILNYPTDNPTITNLAQVEKSEYETEFVHPILKKRFGGPSRLDIKDHSISYFISPLTLIVETSSVLKGYMLMDTFVSTIRCIYTTDIKFNSENKIVYDTKLSIGVSIEFVKETWFKARITDEMKMDHDGYINEDMMPLIKKLISHLLEIKKNPNYSMLTSIIGQLNVNISSNLTSQFNESVNNNNVNPVLTSNSLENNAQPLLSEISFNQDNNIINASPINSELMNENKSNVRNNNIGHVLPFTEDVNELVLFGIIAFLIIEYFIFFAQSGKERILVLIVTLGFSLIFYKLEKIERILNQRNSFK